jgi:hypothetical protein
MRGFLEGLDACKENDWWAGLRGLRGWLTACGSPCAFSSMAYGVSGINRVNSANASTLFRLTACGSACGFSFMAYTISRVSVVSRVRSNGSRVSMASRISMASRLWRVSRFSRAPMVSNITRKQSSTRRSMARASNMLCCAVLFYARLRY